MRRGGGQAAGDGFSLVELLVVIGIIALLIAILLPTLGQAREQAKWVQCQSNLRTVGQLLNIYANDHRGYLYPPGLGAGRPPEERWPVHVFKPAVYNPAVMLCPSDESPKYEHSYLLNDHIRQREIKASSTQFGGLTVDRVVLMGEKNSNFDDYYMNIGDYDTRVEPYRHGRRRGSNYLFLDYHVGLLMPNDARAGIDPWDVASTPTGG